MPGAFAELLCLEVFGFLKGYFKSWFQDPFKGSLKRSWKGSFFWVPLRVP